MSDSSEDEETVAALLAARTAREERRAHERRTALDVARLVAHAEAVSARGQWIEAIELYTRGVAQQPNDTELLAARASACARAGHYAAALHDGELMVSLLPDWYRGYQVCGSALFCLRRFASAARAYSAAVRLAAPSTTGGLRDALHDCHKKIDDALRRAIMEDDLDALSSLLASGEVQLQMADESNGFVPLTLAAAAGRRHACAVLLDAGADPNARDKYGKTPLLWAAAFGHQAAAAELLGTHRGHQASTEQSASGSSLNSRIFEGGPSEITACIDDSMGIDDGNRRSDGDRRPFGMENSGAAIHHHLPSHSPSRAVADLRATDYRGWDALFHACYAGHLQLAKSFMQGVDLARTDKDGATVLHVAAHGSRAPVVSLLLRAGANPSAMDARLRTPLDLAIAQRNALLVRGSSSSSPPSSHPDSGSSETDPLQKAIDVVNVLTSAGGGTSRERTQPADVITACNKDKGVATTDNVRGDSSAGATRVSSSSSARACGRGMHATLVALLGLATSIALFPTS